MAVIAPRPAIETAPLTRHGAFDYDELERLGLNPDDVLDFSVNSNPFGPSPTVRQALATIPLDRYPDRECLALRRALSQHWNVPVEQIIVGNGSAELLWLTALAYLQPGDRALVIGPTFGEYERAAALMGAHIVRWNARRETGFAVEPQDVARQLSESRPRVAFCCNPNNPTGAATPLEVIAAWAGDNTGTLFVVDEAYLAFAPGLPSAVEVVRGRSVDNILVMRSMTKDYALAGLRLGYAIGPVPIISTLAKVRPAWNVNALAQAAGLAALADQSHLRQTLAALHEAKTELIAGLERLGRRAFPSAVHFFLLEVGNGAAFRRSLLRHGLQVRDCASFGLPAYVRIATRRPAENARLLQALQAHPQDFDEW